MLITAEVTSFSLLNSVMCVHVPLFSPAAAELKGEQCFQGVNKLLSVTVGPCV